jgi:hypothetical protein
MSVYPNHLLKVEVAIKINVSYTPYALNKNVKYLKIVKKGVFQ